MFKHSTSVILRDDVLEVFLGSRTKDSIGDGLVKCLGHDDVSLTGFVMEEFSHRRYQKVKKGF